jgi:hypothetical protein
MKGFRFNELGILQGIFSGIRSVKLLITRSASGITVCRSSGLFGMCSKYDMVTGHTRVFDASFIVCFLGH